MQVEENKPDENSFSKDSKAETIKELSDRHLADENHTTSDEELRNARIVLDDKVEVDEENLFEVDNTPVIPGFAEEVEDKTSTDAKDEKTDKEQDKGLPNPYDVLGS